MKCIWNIDLVPILETCVFQSAYDRYIFTDTSDGNEMIYTARSVRQT